MRVAATALLLFGPGAQLAIGQTADPAREAVDHANLETEVASAPIEVIVVTATRAAQIATDAPASVSVVSRAEMDLRRNQRLGDVLADVPGLYLRGNTTGAAFPSSAQASIAIRGVPRTTRTLILVDGLPINSALSGGINLAAITVDELARVEVVRGPYSALYGGNAMAGVVHFVTEPPRHDSASVRLERSFEAVSGSAATIRVAARANEQFGWSLLVAYRRSDSWDLTDEVVKVPSAGTGIPVTGAQVTSTPDGRPALLVGDKGSRPWNQRNARLQLFAQPASADALHASLSYADYRVGYTSPQSLLRDNNGSPVLNGSVLAMPLAGRIALLPTDFAAFTPSTERDARIATQWQRRFDNGGSLTAHVGVLQHQFNFAQPAPGATFDAGVGTWTAQQDTRSDVDLSVRQPITPQSTLILGGGLTRLSLDRHDDLASLWRDAGSRTQRLNRGEGRMRAIAAFAQIETSISARVTALAGARLDRFVTDGVVAQFSAPVFEQRIAARQLQQASPKLALVFDMHSDWVLRGSLGRGFRAPTLLDLYSRSASPTNVAGVVSVNEPSPHLRAESLDAFELGVERRAGPWRGALNVFAQRLDGLIYRSRISPTLTQSVNAGAARIDGIECQVRTMPSRGWSTFANVTRLVRAQLTENTAIPASVGKTLTDVALTQWNLGLSYEREPTSAAIFLRHTGHVFGSGDDTNLNVRQGVYGSYDARTVTAAKLSYRVTPWVRISVSLDNLTNRRYFDFGRQPGRNGLIEVTVSH